MVIPVGICLSPPHVTAVSTTKACPFQTPIWSSKVKNSDQANRLFLTKKKNTKSTRNLFQVTTWWVVTSSGLISFIIPRRRLYSPTKLKQETVGGSHSTPWINWNKDDFSWDNQLDKQRKISGHTLVSWTMSLSVRVVMSVCAACSKSSSLTKRFAVFLSMSLNSWMRNKKHQNSQCCCLSTKCTFLLKPLIRKTSDFLLLWTKSIGATVKHRLTLDGIWQVWVLLE